MKKLFLLPLLFLLLALPASAQTLVAGSTATVQRTIRVDELGVQYARSDSPNRFSCVVTVSTATTLQAVGGSCAAPGSGISLYITDIMFSSNAQAIAADAFPTLKYGTGGTCGTGTNVFWGAFLIAATQGFIFNSFATPIKIPANNEICWINTTAGSKFLVINGYTSTQ